MNAQPTASSPIVLVGLMATGKSTVGRRVASRLGVPFVDTDAEIETRQGMTVAELFASDGEPAFRALEEAVIAELLAQPVERVIAVGGGAVLSAATRALLRSRARVVWLRATPGTLAHRARQNGSRPLLADDPRGTLERLAAERSPLYEEVAHHVIDVDQLDRRAVSARIVDAIRAASTAAPTAVPSGEVAP